MLKTTVTGDFNPPGPIQVLVRSRFLMLEGRAGGTAD